MRARDVQFKVQLKYRVLLVTMIGKLISGRAVDGPFGYYERLNLIYCK